MYASALGDNAVERYAMFLVSLALSADVAERRLALTRAKDHGLDMDRVAIATAERTIEKAFEVRFYHPPHSLSLVKKTPLFTIVLGPDSSSAKRQPAITHCTSASRDRRRTVPSSVD